MIREFRLDPQPPTRWLVLALALLALPGAATAQGLTTSVGAGIARPDGGLADTYDTGFTVRGQVGLGLGPASIHLQGGWTRFSAEAEVPEDVDDTASFAHLAGGARLGMGFAWLGANAGYFSGDGEEGLGFFPEAGVGIGRIEVVFDIRTDGDAKWWALRGAIRF